MRLAPFALAALMATIPAVAEAKRFNYRPVAMKKPGATVPVQAAKATTAKPAAANQRQGHSFVFISTARPRSSGPQEPATQTEAPALRGVTPMPAQLAQSDARIPRGQPIPVLGQTDQAAAPARVPGFQSVN